MDKLASWFNTFWNTYGISIPGEVWQSAALSLLAIAFLFLWIAVWVRRGARKAKGELKQAEQLLKGVQPTHGLEKNLGLLLEMTGTLVEAPTYSFYVKDSEQKPFVLKAVRHNAPDFGKVKPSYSGLVPYSKEAYLPPISLAEPSIPAKSAIVKEGEVPLLLVPIKGGRGALRIGPLKVVSKRAKRALDRFGGNLEQILETLIETEEMKKQVEISKYSSQAMQRISDIATDREMTFDALVGAVLRNLGADGGFCLVPEADGFHLLAPNGADPALRAQLAGDAELHRLLCSLAEDDEIIIVGQADAGFQVLPEGLKKRAANLSLVKVDDGLLAFWQGAGRPAAEMGAEERSLILTAAEELGAILRNQQHAGQLSRSYINLLKTLARMMDNLNAYTVGYSELMSHYSIVIGRQMGLPEDEIRDIALAAYLSNIGVLGLSNELSEKEGKYTEMEFELMKLHAEVGAAIVSVMTGNKRVAANILHHHERMDGNGYPGGLAGQEIPVGARIIAVVQTFLAKINGRKSRDPLPFDQALKMLTAASGTQLDEEVVGGLFRWFETKQNNPAFSERSIGSCWEMCCTPSSICEHCPVYGRLDVNCWEVGDNNCASHGKKCDTCFVRTEYVTRKPAGLLK